MKRRAIGFVLMFVMCLGLALPAFALQAATGPGPDEFVRITNVETQWQGAQVTRIFNEGYRLQWGLYENAWGIVNRYGTLAAPFMFYSIEFINHDLLAAQNMEGKWGLIDLHGNAVMPFAHEAAPSVLQAGDSEHPSLYRVSEQRETGLYFGAVSETGEAAIPVLYRSLYRGRGHTNRNLFVVSLWDEEGQSLKWGMVNAQGDVVIEIDITFGDYTPFAGNTPVGPADANHLVVYRWASDGARFAGVVEIGTGYELIPIAYRGMFLLGNGFFAASRYHWQDVIWGDVPTTWMLYNANAGGQVTQANYTLNEMRALAGLMSALDGNVRPHHGNVQRVHWFNELRGSLGTQEMEILCLATGQIARARSIANGNHADIVGTTTEYQAMLADFRNVLVTVGGRTMPAAMERFWPSEHFCLHFYGSTQNNDGRSWGMGHIYFGERAGELIRKYMLD